ncbi:MAG: MATE family efflux transporter [Lachnospiraceae bacterium]|nr:MATE family efflux transporter [Lachnospiraceae bacterium]
MSAQQTLTEGKPMPIILKFFLPLFIGNVFQQLYNMVDTIIVGHYVGTGALAAVGSTGTIMFLVMGFAIGMTTGFTVITAQKFGAEDIEGVKRSVANGFLLSLITIVVLTVASVAFMNPLLHLMNTPADIYEDAYSYIITICYGSFALVFYNLFSAYCRAMGNSKVPLFFLVFSAILNVILDLVFIINFKLGVMGAALATDCAQGVSAVLCLIYILKKFQILVPRREHWYLSWHMTRKQLNVAVPMALQFAITASGTMVMQTAINLFGSEAVAAFTASSKLCNLVTQGFPSVGQTMATYVGQNYGKGDLKRIHAGVRSSMVLTLIYAIISGICMVLFLRPALTMFFDAGVDIDAMVVWAKPYVYMAAACFFPLGMIFIFRNTMQGCGRGLLPLIGGIVEFVARLVAAVISMKIMSYTLAVACDPLAWIAAGIYTFVAYLFMMKRMEKNFDDRREAI